MKRIAVFSGGGANGAFTVGRLSKLNKSYDGAVCVSTGALLGPLALLKKYDRLKESYEVTNKDIYTHSPFNKNGKFKYITGFFRLFKKVNSFGDSTNLRKYIDTKINEDDYIKLKSFDIRLGVHSITNDVNVFVSNKKTSFKEFKDWMYISANAALIMSIVEKTRPSSDVVEQWCDGGVTEAAPLRKACFMAGKGGEVDVFLHSTKKRIPNKKIYRIIDNIKWFFKLNISRTVPEDLKSGLDVAQDIGCKINLYYMPEEYYKNPFNFNKEKMQDLYQKGCDNYNVAVEIKDYR